MPQPLERPAKGACKDKESRSPPETMSASPSSASCKPSTLRSEIELTLLVTHNVRVHHIAAAPELILQVLPRCLPGQVAHKHCEKSFTWVEIPSPGHRCVLRCSPLFPMRTTLPPSPSTPSPAYSAICSAMSTPLSQRDTSILETGPIAQRIWDFV